MPTNLVPVDTLPANLTIASDGEAVSEATRLLVMQDYADYLLYIRTRTLPPGGITVPAILPEPASNGGPGSFVWVPGVGCWNENVGAGDVAEWPVAIMPTQTGAGVTWQITLVTIWTINDAGHGGLDPAVDQNLSLDYTDPTTGGITNVMAVSDPAAAAGLDVIHSFGSGALTHSLLDNVTYTLTYTGESGANAQADTRILGVFFNLEVV